ncbi:Protein SRG1 [Capsicum annuum]|uniref:Protein SRG1 n=1 Tax=Capsicum annuum TaxID=4072 RepID=A0A2G3A7A4_CAPAN|nr:Protein SRG1 [Capsicum annuum]
MLRAPNVVELAKQKVATIPLRYIHEDIENTTHSSSMLFPQVPDIDMEKLLAIETIQSLRGFILHAENGDFSRDLMEAYCKEIQTLAMIIICQLAKALSMDEKEMRDVFVDGVQSMRMNYYPPCPEPGKTYGLNPHSDTTAFTILLQLNETEGPQVRKDNIWVPIKPLPNAFIVTIGDMIEVNIYYIVENFEGMPLDMRI